VSLSTSLLIASAAKKFAEKLTWGGVINYIGIPINKDLEKNFASIFSEINPDVLHVIGAEGQPSLDAVTAFNNPNRTIVSICGIRKLIARHFFDGIPEKIAHRRTLRDIVKNDSLMKYQKAFYDSAEVELKIVKYCKNFFGRTDFDRAFVTQINPDCNYFHCNEILRGEFYSSEKLWNYNACEKHSLLMSQAHYPLKGLHFLIEAMGILAEKYPDIKLSVGGYTIRIIPKDFKDYMMQSSYARYCWDMIKKYNLQDKITFTGPIDTNSMLEEFLKAHVFVSPSTMENESNSLSEAKILGVPCTASYVGGVTNRVKHKEDGYLYPFNEPYMLAYYVDEIFQMKERAAELGQKARENILKLVDPKTNAARNLEVYKKLMEKN